MIITMFFLSYFVFCWFAKRHELLNKGNFEKPFVYGRYATLRARVGENVLGCCYWRGANERERERERESSKLFGTTK